ncbi:hypothetical protein SFRURICE_010328 [Spodoptera frugiperda]|nr:hypothetical protein SFRURICE_010328 [Spodoptera frugiperda]
MSVDEAKELPLEQRAPLVQVSLVRPVLGHVGRELLVVLLRRRLQGRHSCIQSRSGIEGDHTGDITRLQQRLEKIETTLHENDQRLRLNNVEIKGVPVTSSENLFTIVSKICTKVNCEVRQEQINYIARVPQRNSKDNKNIIMSLHNRYLRDDFIAAAKKCKNLTITDIGLNGSGNIYVNDHLTFENKQLLNKAKLLAKEKNFSYIWQGSGNSLMTQLAYFYNNLHDKIVGNLSDYFLVLGDFNLPNLCWLLADDGHSYYPVNIQGSILSDFFDVMNICNLLQYNSHINTNGRILDLVFCNNVISIDRCPDPLLPEDPHHVALDIFANFVECQALRNQSRIKYLYQAADFASISRELDGFNWHRDLKDGSVEEASSLLYSRLNKSCNTYIPTKRVQSSCKYPAWYKSPLIKLLKEKFKFHSKFKKYGNLSDRESFILLRDRAKVLEKSMFEDYIKSVENNIYKSPKAFWSYVKSRNSSNSYPSIMTYGQHASGLGDDICNMFSNYFYRNFLPSEAVDVDRCHDQGCNHQTVADISSVERRRIADIATLFKIANSGMDCPELLSKLGLVTHITLLRNPRLIHVPRVRTTYRQNSFMLRAGKSFNVISRDVDLDLFNTSVARLKRCLSIPAESGAQRVSASGGGGALYLVQGGAHASAQRSWHDAPQSTQRTPVWNQYNIVITYIYSVRSKQVVHTLSGPHSRSWQWSQRAGAAAGAGAQRWAGGAGGAGAGGAAARRPRTSTSSVPRLCTASVARRTTPDDIDELRCGDIGRTLLLQRTCSSSVLGSSSWSQRTLHFCGRWPSSSSSCRIRSSSPVNESGMLRAMLS